MRPASPPRPPRLATIRAGIAAAVFAISCFLSSASDSS